MFKVDGRDVLVIHEPGVGSIAATPASAFNPRFEDAKVLYVAWVIYNPEDKQQWCKKIATKMLTEYFEEGRCLPVSAPFASPDKTRMQSIHSRLRNLLNMMA